MVLPEDLTIEYENFSTEKNKKATEMNKMKPAPSTIVIANAMTRDIYGIDMPAAKRQIQVEKRKARLAETKSKDLETKSKDLETRSKEAWIVITNLILALRFDRTAEELAAIAKISLSDVTAILAAHPLENEG